KAPAGGAASTGRKVALFATCSVEYYQTSTGRAAVNVLERNRVDVSLPPQRCCGMPYLDGGAVDEAKALIRDNVASLAAAAREAAVRRGDGGRPGHRDGLPAGRAPDRAGNGSQAEAPGRSPRGGLRVRGVMG